LREALFGELFAHHEARVAGGAAKVHEAAFGQQNKSCGRSATLFVILRFTLIFFTPFTC